MPSDFEHELWSIVRTLSTMEPSENGSKEFRIKSDYLVNWAKDLLAEAQELAPDQIKGADAEVAQEVKALEQAQATDTGLHALDIEGDPDEQERIVRERQQAIGPLGGKWLPPEQITMPGGTTAWVRKVLHDGEVPYIRAEHNPEDVIDREDEGF